MKRFSSQRNGFSLIELLTAMTVLGVLMLALSQIVSGAFTTWMRGRSHIDKFQQARAAMQTLQDTLSQAVLSPHLEYQYDPAALTIPVAYRAESELRFRTGEAANLFIAPPDLRLEGQGVLFAAALGRDTSGQRQGPRAALNTCGFFTGYGSDDRWLPGSAITAGLAPRRRHRLFLVCQPVSEFPVYGEFYDPQAPAPAKPAHPVAENIALLLLLPMRDETTLAGGEPYDSAQHQHELPSLLRVIMLALDERSAQRLEASGESQRLIPASLFHRLDTAAVIENDLDRLRRHLDQSLSVPVDYQILDQLIPLPASRWNG